MNIATLEAALTHSSAASSDFDLNPGVILPEGRVLRPAAVLVPFVETPRGLRLMLTKRSSKLKHHPGQIAFPGGKAEPGERPEDTALREAHEEVGLPRANARVLGQLPTHETVTSFTITPVLAHVAGFDPVPEPGEVEEVFTVPLPHVLTPGHYLIEKRRWRGEWRHFYAVPYGPYYIWGATARILRGLAERVDEGSR
ncbi:MAG: CoA pyrophosphatase [Pseudomonadota bacterium]